MPAYRILLPALAAAAALSAPAPAHALDFCFGFPVTIAGSPSGDNLPGTAAPATTCSTAGTSGT